MSVFIVLGGFNLEKLRSSMFVKEYLWQTIVTIGGLFVIALTLIIGAFLIYKGSDTFLTFHHSIGEFLGSTDFNPTDNEMVEER